MDPSEIDRVKSGQSVFTVHPRSERFGARTLVVRPVRHRKTGRIVRMTVQWSNPTGGGGVAPKTREA